jgi:hypothetical protein
MATKIKNKVDRGKRGARRKIGNRLNKGWRATEIENKVAGEKGAARRKIGNRLM